jgi:two-component system, chemotaxis family, sensor histidine kinase and response regulator WspE
MSQTSGDDFLIELFREEVRTNCQILADGLVSLEQGNTSPERLEAMMRAAHSIKGAARVVNVQPGVEVAHAMEDCFVRTQKAELTLTGNVVDILLAGVDMLHGISAAAGAGFSAWLENHQPEVTQLLKHLDNVLRESKSQVSPSPAFMDVQKTATDVVQTSAPKESVAPPAPTMPTIEIPPQPAPSNVAPKSPETSTEEGVVRVTARSLTRLMGLAGESLVEARWLQPFSKSLLQLKHLQSQLTDTLESLSTIDQSEVSEERIAALRNDAREQLAACRDLLADRMSEFDRRIRNTDDLSSRLYHEVISSRMRPFRDGVQGLPRLVRDLARQMGKKAQLEIQGDTTEVDRDILERLDAPLNHLVRNALDHGLETPEERQAVGKPDIGRLHIEAAHRAGLLSITVSDDGRGIDRERLRGKVVERGLASADLVQKLSDTELLDFLLLPGFSTASQVTEISGRGVGLDVVHTMVQSVGGRIQIHSEPGQGTSFQIQLPLTLSVLRAVIVDIAGEPYAFPQNRIDRVIRVACDELRSLENRQYFEVDGQNVGIVMARQVFKLDAPESVDKDLLVVLFSERSAQYGLVVDGLRGEQDLVIRPMDRRLGKVPNLHAAALLDDGSPVLIVDPDDLCRSIEKLLYGSRLERVGTHAASPEESMRKRILVVDDSITVREVERQLLANQGYEVEVAVDGMEGWNRVREGRFDLVISDIDMPRLNGLDLVRKIKADARLQAIPVVIVSYKDREEDRLLGLEAGANHYLTKSSFHDDTLIQTVRELIGSPEA